MRQHYFVLLDLTKGSEFGSEKNRFRFEIQPFSENGRQTMPTGLDECFSKKASYHTGFLVVSSVHTSYLSITGICDAH